MSKKFKPWDAGFKNVDPKLIRAVEDKLETVHRLLHTGEPLTASESYPLEVEEKELVRALENLYEDRHPQFRVGKGQGRDPDFGRYIDPHEDE